MTFGEAFEELGLEVEPVPKKEGAIFIETIQNFGITPGNWEIRTFETRNGKTRKPTRIFYIFSADYIPPRDPKLDFPRLSFIAPNCTCENLENNRDAAEHFLTLLWDTQKSLPLPLPLTWANVVAFDLSAIPEKPETAELREHVERLVELAGKHKA